MNRRSFFSRLAGGVVGLMVAPDVTTLLRPYVPLGQTHPNIGAILAKSFDQVMRDMPQSNVWADASFLEAMERSGGLIRIASDPIEVPLDYRRNP